MYSPAIKVSVSLLGDLSSVCLFLSVSGMSGGWRGLSFKVRSFRPHLKPISDDPRGAGRTRVCQPLKLASLHAHPFPVLHSFCNRYSGSCLRLSVGASLGTVLVVKRSRKTRASYLSTYEMRMLFGAIPDNRSDARGRTVIRAPFSTET